MKVLHVISGIAREQGGPTYALEGLARAQKAIGLDVTVLATWQMVEGRDNAKTFHEMGVACHVYGPAYGKFSRLKGLNEIVAGHVRAADVVHIHAMWEEVQHVAAVEAGRAKKPYVWRACNAISATIMNKNYWLKRGVLAWRLKHDLNNAAAMHYATENERDESAWLGLKPTALVEPNGIELGAIAGNGSRFLERFSQMAGKRILLFVGRLSPEKGLDLLLPAFARARRDNWSLVLVGSDPVGSYRSTVESLIKHHGLNEHVLLTGHLDGEAKADAYAVADLFVLPSRSENFGNVVVEAMASRVVPIVTRGVGLARELEATGMGVVTDYSIEAIADILTRYFSSGGPFRLSGVQAQAIRDRYAWTTIASRWREHYAKLLDASRPLRQPVQASAGGSL